MRSNIFEVLKRAKDGPYINENDFNMKLFRTCSKLVKEYEIKFDREKIVVGDEKMADRLFEASLKLCLEMGMFCIDSSRIIEFSEEELKSALMLAPQEMVLGEGKDIRVLRARKFNDGYRMTVCGGCPGTPFQKNSSCR